MSQPNEILLFPNGAPGEIETLEEKVNPFNIKVGGKSVQIITNVSEPTIRFYPAPKDNNSGATIIVAPGGGYNVLAYDLEGTEVCELFNTYGVNCVLLKYRVPIRKDQPMYEAPLQDMQRAIAYTRSHAKEWNIHEDKIGVMGFSAGAHLAALASNCYDELSYLPIDMHDQMPICPNFALIIYPGFLDGDNFTVAPEIEVSKDTCPTFIVQTQDDHKLLNSSLFYYYALKEARVSVAMHLYPTGYHGYGVRDTGHLVNEWPLRAMDWMRDKIIVKNEK